MACFVKGISLPQSELKVNSQNHATHMLCSEFFFFLNFAVLKSSHGSANFSVLGNRSVKNETSPSGDRQVSKNTHF